MTDLPQYGPYLHGVDGPVVVLPANVCDFLERHAGLDEYRKRNLGRHPQLDHALLSLHSAATAYRASRTGTPEISEPEPPTSSWVGTTKAARILRMTDRGVRRACEQGRLEAHQVEGRWRIAREDLAQFRTRQTGATR